MSQGAPLAQLQAALGPAVLATHSLHGDDTAMVEAPRILEVMRFLKDTPGLAFDQLIDLTCVDTLGLDPRAIRAIGGSTVEGAAAAGRFQVVYHLRSSTLLHRLRIKAAVDETEAGAHVHPPEIDTVTGLWKSAIWAEREAWDMFGVKFRGHPDLRRLLLYEEFIGHPLRKDYPKDKRQPLVRRDFT